jgi:hypothetical protein
VVTQDDRLAGRHGGEDLVLVLIQPEMRGGLEA